MVVKSIIDVEVNDESFKAFSTLFDKYQEKVKALPGAWGDTNKEMAKGFQMMTAAMMAQNELARRNAADQRRANQSTRESDNLWRSISRSTGEVAGHIRRATGDILRWGALTGAVSGLLGVGGLFGIDTLARSAASGRRFSMGIGAGYGEQRAFSANFGRLVDPESFLSAVSNARLDVTKRTGLYGAGLGERDLGGSTAEVSVALLQRLKQLADSTDPRLYGQLISSRQLGQFTTPEDLQRLRNTSQGELNQLFRAYGQNKGGFDLSDDTTKRWQDFTTQMNRAGQGIENTFVKGLARIEPGLEKLSVSIEKVIGAFVNSDAVSRWMDLAGKGLEKLADYIGTDKFQQDVESFARDVGNLAKAVHSALGWLGRDREAEAHDAGELTTDERAARLKAARTSGSASSWSQFKDIFSGNSPRDVEAKIRAAAIKRGIDPNIAVKVAQSEGLYNYVGDKGTSFGPFQLHYKNNIPGLSNGGLGDDFTKATGLNARDPATIDAQIDFALDHAKKHGWGAFHGAANTGIPNGAGISKIVIENNTGGNAIVTTNQVAQ